LEKHEKFGNTKFKVASCFRANNGKVEKKLFVLQLTHRSREGGTVQMV
jgi:hypothetical protein